MSQFFISSTVAPPPPTVPTSFVTDSGTAVPALNTINIATSSSSINTTNGITSTGSLNNIDIILTNRITGAVTTVGAVTTTCMTFNLGVTPGVYGFEIFLNALDTTTPSGASYRIRADLRTTGAAATIIGTVDYNENEEAAMVPADWVVSAVGNSLVLNVTGVAGLTVRWSASGIFTFVS